MPRGTAPSRGGDLRGHARRWTCDHGGPRRTGRSRASLSPASARGHHPPCPAAHACARLLRACRSRQHGHTGFVKAEFDATLACGRPEHGIVRLRCASCGHDAVVAFSCKCRGFCPSCGTRRMEASAAHLVDRVLPRVPVRQFVLTLPIPLQLLLAVRPGLIGPVLGVVHRLLARHLAALAGLRDALCATGAVTIIQRFGSAANLNVHFRCLALDGVYWVGRDGRPASTVSSRRMRNCVRWSSRNRPDPRAPGMTAAHRAAPTRRLRSVERMRPRPPSLQTDPGTLRRQIIRNRCVLPKTVSGRCEHEDGSM